MGSKFIDENRILTLHKAGWSFYKIARELGCHRSSITKYAKKLGLQVNVTKYLPRGLPEAAIVDALRRGVSVGALARIHKCNRASILRYAKKNGIDPTKSRKVIVAKGLPQPLYQLLHRIKSEDFTLREVAERAGLANGTVNQWMLKGYVPTLPNFMAACEAVDLRVVVMDEEEYKDLLRWRKLHTSTVLSDGTFGVRSGPKDRGQDSVSG